MPSTAEKILAFIREFVESRGTPPTLREIQAKFKFANIGGVQYYMKKLMKAGHLTVEPRVAHGIRLTSKAVGIPILGRVPAGVPLQAIEDVEGYLTGPGATGKHTKGNLFALKVKGDSMVDAFIAEGDIVIVDSDAEARNGDIVVARIGEDEATIKRFHQTAKVIELVPANPHYKPIPVTEQTAILGKVIRVLRDYA